MSRLKSATADQAAFYAELIAITEDPLALVDDQYVIRIVNPAYERLADRSRDQIEGRTVAEVFGQPFFETESRPRLDRALAGERCHRHSWSDELDGGQRFIRVRYTPCTAPNGARLVAVQVTDLTELRTAEEARNATEARFQTLVENAPVGIFQTTSDGRVLHVNPHMAQIVRAASPEEACERYENLGTQFYADPQRRREFVAQLSRDGELRDFEYEAKRLDDSRCWISMAARVSERRPDGVLVIDGFAQDITQRKLAEEERASLARQLQQSQKLEAIGQLAGGVAHDFNNILTAILGNAELCLIENDNHASPSAELSSRLQEIQDSAERAAVLTRQLLTFSRRRVIRPEVLDPNTMLRDLERMLRRLITEDIELTLRLESDLPTVRVDPGQLEQVVINLAVNARDAMPQGGRLIIESMVVEMDEDAASLHADAYPGLYALIAVSDTGCGMDRATMDRVFEPFFTTKPAGKGTGLGLSTAYGIVKQAGGHIGVYSETNSGTTFRVYLPAAHEPVPVNTADEARLPPVGGSERILVCEDDEAVRALVTDALRSVGYRVVEAESPAHALQLAAADTDGIDLLITDVVMPGMNGRKLSEALRALRHGLKTLFVSGYTADVIAHQGVLNAGIEFLEKPFSRRRLLERVRSVLDA